MVLATSFSIRAILKKIVTGCGDREIPFTLISSDRDGLHRLIDATSTLFCSFWQVICFLNGNFGGWIYGESFIAFLVNTPGNALFY
jgi:hypothetical protein